MCSINPRPYKTSANIVYSCKYPIVWCPKYRRKVLEGDIATRLEEIIRQTAAERNVAIIELEIMPDHIHLLCKVHPQYGVNPFIKLVNGRRAHFLRSEFPSLRSRLTTLWTGSYFISTVGGAHLDIVKQYIENQKNV